MQHPTPAQIKSHILQALYDADDEVRRTTDRKHLHLYEATRAVDAGIRAANAEKRAEASHVS